MPELALALQAADELVVKIQAYAGADATASREYDTPIDERNFGTLVGRKVWVFPDSYTWTPITRGRDDFDAMCQIVVAERYTANAPRVPNDWIDERVLWVQGLWKRLAEQRGAADKWPSGEDGWVPVFDPQQLREFAMFWVKLPALTIRSRQTPPVLGG